MSDEKEGGRVAFLFIFVYKSGGENNLTARFVSFRAQHLQQTYTLFQSNKSVMT